MLKLIKHPNPILQKILPDFDFNNPIMDPYALEEQMIQLMTEENGRGLSANQVGIEARVFVIKTENLESVNTPFAVFNPLLTFVSDDLNQDYEGCLSFPNLFLPVKRSNRIGVQFLDRDKKEYIIELTGIDARCFLHELDHLNGICFTDGISKLKLDLATKRQRKLNGRTQQRSTIGV
jgi:peptide deformylase